MNRLRLLTRVWLAVLLAIPVAAQRRSGDASAHSGDTFGPACGAAVIDGQVDPAEWSSAAAQTFVMQSPNIATPMTVTLRVMNGAANLYLGITIEDDEFSTSAEFLQGGDQFRIDFDDDHSGALFTVGDDVLFALAGAPQFADGYISGVPSPQSSPEDVAGGGSSDGAAAGMRVSDSNHFEIRHPLSSGDALDFDLPAGGTVGFRMEYLDAQADGSFGGSLLYPGFDETSAADIVIGACAVADVFVHLPLISK